MKRNILSLAVTAGVAGLAATSAQSAMHLNEKGLGETLIYPFYSAEGGNDTYVHVANTTAYAKAVKVRFIGAFNSAEVLDFNLYLSPEDMWTAAITVLPAHEENGGFAGGVGIRTADTSCTVPMLGQSNPPYNGRMIADSTVREQPFVNFQFQKDAQLVFPGSSTIAAEVEELDLAARGHQGYIEIIEMGVIDPDADTGTVPGSATYDYFKAIKHTADGVPGDCAALTAAWSQTGVWTTAAQTDFLPYSDTTAGGLYGLAQVINTSDGTMASYDAVAIDDFADRLLGVAHTQPGDVLPNLSNSQTTATIFDGALAVDYDFSASGNAFDAVSSLFMATEIINDYLIDPVVLGQTDWVVTMPTKRAHVLADRSATGLNAPASSLRAVQPFYSAWDGEKACEPFSIDYWDREEAIIDIPPGQAGFSPRPPSTPVSPDPLLCKEVNIITFNDGIDTDSSALYGSAGITQGVTVNYDAGWAEVSFDNTKLVSPRGNVGNAAVVPAASATVPARQIDSAAYTFYGLPVTGFAVVKYKDESGTNVSTEGAVLNYAGSFKHKVVTSIAAASAP